MSSRLAAALLTLSLAAAEAASAARELIVLAPASWTHGTSIELSTLRRLFLGKRASIGAGSVQCIDFPPGSESHDRFRRRVLKMSERRLSAHWIEQALQGGALPPEEVEDVEALYVRLRGRGTPLGYAWIDPETEPPPADLLVLKVTEGGRTLRLTAD